MEVNGLTPNFEPVEQENGLEDKKTEALMAKLEKEQNFPLAVVGGIAAAITGAVVWAAVTVGTGYQIGWMAVGVGFLVGFTVRSFGRGISNSFGILGAACALLGCLLGNFLSSCGFISIQEQLSFLKFTFSLLTDPLAIVELFKLTFSPMDLMFYGIAIFEGYKFSFRQVEIAETQPVPADDSDISF